MIRPLEIRSWEQDFLREKLACEKERLYVFQTTT
jgi:hypothetical protein